MKPNHAQRIRFGILAARHMLERGRLTDWQVDDVEGMEDAGWKVSDVLKAFEREVINIQRRNGRMRYSFRARRLSLRQTNA